MTPAFLRRITREQRGFSLVEQIASIAVFMLVMGAVLSLLESSSKVAPRDHERANVIRESQAGLHRMVRELRQADRVNSFEPGAIEIVARLPLDNPNTGGVVETHSLWDVRYTCNAETPGKCSRFATIQGGAYPSVGETVIDRIENWEESMPAARKVFTLGQGTSIAPTYISVRVEVPARGERAQGAGHRGAVILQDGFALRNIR